MKDIIINQPNLQSFPQKCGSWFIALLSWFLWLYFLFPLFTLGAWLLGLKHLSEHIRWFGGYKTLLELLELYAEIIIVIALAWLGWMFLQSWLHRGDKPNMLPPVSEQEICNVFKLQLATLQQAKTEQLLTLHFDEHALITSMNCDNKQQS